MRQQGNAAKAVKEEDDAANQFEKRRQWIVVIEKTPGG